VNVKQSEKLQLIGMLVFAAAAAVSSCERLLEDFIFGHTCFCQFVIHFFEIKITSFTFLKYYIYEIICITFIDRSLLLPVYYI